MKLLRSLTALTMTLSLVGCCCGRNVVTDGCDTCCTSPAVGILRLQPVRNFFRFGCFHRCGCGGGCGSYGDVMGGCGDCATGGCSSGSCGAPMSQGFAAPGGTGCGCTSPATYSSQYPNMNAPSSSIQIPEPSSLPTPAPVPPTSPTSVPPATPSSDSSTMNPPRAMPPVQNVSYEEFQKLPGTVISGPGASTGTSPGVPSNATMPMTMAPPVAMAPPANSVSSIQRSIGSTQRLLARPASSMPPAMVSSQVQQPVWVPAK